MNIGRNEPCFCQSGIKYKKCCLGKPIKPVKPVNSFTPKNGAPPQLTAPGDTFSRKTPTTLNVFNLSSFSEINDLNQVPQVEAKSRIPKSKDFSLNQAIDKIYDRTMDAVEFSLNPLNCREISYTFLIDEQDEEFEHDHDFYYDDEPSLLKVVVSEEAPDGVMKIYTRTSSDFENKSILTAPFANAALLMTWMIINSNSFDELLKFAPSKIPNWKKLRKQFSDISQKQKNLATELEQTAEQLSKITLQSISIRINTRTLIENEGISNQLNPPDLVVQKWPGPDLLSSSTHRLHDITNFSQQIPSIFCNDESQSSSSPMDLFGSRYLQSDETCAEVAEALVYGFSDGIFVNSREILKNPRALLVPPDLIPGHFEIEGAKKFWSKKFSIDPRENFSEKDRQHRERLSDELLLNIDWNWRQTRRSDFKTASVQNIEKVIRSVITAISYRLSIRELEVNLCCSENKKEVQFLPIKEFFLGGSSKLEWQTFLSLQPEKNNASNQHVNMRTELVLKNSKNRVVILRNGILDLDSKSFSLFSLFSVVSELKKTQFESAPPGCQKLSVAASLEKEENSKFKITVEAFGQRAIDVFRQYIDIPYLTHCLSKFSFPKYKTALESKPEIHLTENGRIHLLRRLSFSKPNSDSINNDDQHGHIFLSGFSSKTQKLIQTMSGGGLANYFDSEAKFMATSDAKKRDFELRLLKHHGVTNLLLFEALHIQFRGTLSSGEKITRGSEVINFLQVKILGLMGELKYVPSSLIQLEDVCTKKTMQKLFQFIEDHTASVDQHKFLTILPTLPVQAEVEILSFIKQEWLFWFTLLEHLSITTKGEIFAKSRIDFVSQLLKEDQTRSGLLEVAIHDSVNAVFAANTVNFHLNGGLNLSLFVLEQLSREGFDFFINSKKLTKLGDNDFKTELNVIENSPVVPGEQGFKKIDWFELHPKFFLHGKEITSFDAKKFISDGVIEHEGRYFLLPTKSMPSLRNLTRFWEKLRQGQKSKKDSSSESSVYHVDKSQILEMLALRSTGVSVIGGSRWQDICKFYDQLGNNNRELTIPNTLTAQLKDYQKFGVQRLYDLFRLGLGSILADDMGLGKTLQTLAFLEILRCEKRLKRCLIVVPTSLTFNWISEKNKFAPKLPMISFSPKDKEAALNFMSENSDGIIVVTYGLLQEHKELFQQIHWTTIIFDEAQNLKNITAQRTTTARALNADIKICLSGTPLENHLGEFYSLIDLCVPGSLGNLNDFREIYVNPSTIASEDLSYLKLKVRPLVLRRTKNEILSELPDKQENRVVLDFEKKQKKIYRDIAISYNEKIQTAILQEGESKCQLQMLTALLRLRQACSDPGALPGVKYEQISPKLDTLSNALTEIVSAGESALVFTQFLHTLHKTEKVLSALGLPVFTLHGGLSRTSREKVLNDFSKMNSGAILLLTLKTGGVGLNLTKASYVFHLEPWWNPAVENQATDRVHRLGQKRSVQVYRYIMHESVEEKIETLKFHKQQRFNALFSEMEDIDFEKNMDASKNNYLTQDHFKFLLES